MARDIARSHHERFDGTGYPDGLAGDDIPLCGRIVALADVYNALTTKRVYKPAFSHEKSPQDHPRRDREVTSIPTSSAPFCKTRTASWRSASNSRRKTWWPLPALLDEHAELVLRG